MTKKRFTKKSIETDDRRCEDCDYFQPIDSMKVAVCLADDKSAAWPLILSDGEQTNKYGWCVGEMYEADDK